jgi:hypothetical protein
LRIFIGSLLLTEHHLTNGSAHGRIVLRDIGRGAASWGPFARWYLAKGALMRRSIVLVALAAMCLSCPAGAYEYTLQFTPNPGGRDLVVAGYAFKGKTVVGTCSYEVVSGGSGKGGGGGGHTTHYEQACGWDLYGNLLSITPGAPTARATPPASTAPATPPGSSTRRVHTTPG